MTHSSFFLAELLISRLCHDLITPIGAINTGLELFNETTPAHITESQEILNLILHSAQTASARVSFFRSAFGSKGETSTLGDTKHLIENYFMHTKLSFQWQPHLPDDFVLKGWARVLLNSILWLSDCAPRGGIVHISFSQKEDPFSFSLLLKADPIVIHKGTLETLEGHTPIQDLTPRTIPCYLAHSFLQDVKGNLSISQNQTFTELIIEAKGI